MKLRIRDNTLRVRLVRSEVARLQGGELVKQITEFSPTTALVTEVKSTNAVSSPVAEFIDGRLIVRLPQPQVTAWARSDHVGIRAVQPVGPGRTLEILIEKDFECLHPGEEKTSGAYPNPGADRTHRHA